MSRRRFLTSVLEMSSQPFVQPCLLLCRDTELLACQFANLLIRYKADEDGEMIIQLPLCSS